MQLQSFAATIRVVNISGCKREFSYERIIARWLVVWLQRVCNMCCLWCGGCFETHRQVGRIIYTHLSARAVHLAASCCSQSDCSVINLFSSYPYRTVVHFFQFYWLPTQLEVLQCSQGHDIHKLITS